MKVVKREIKDYNGLIDDTLYCINDNDKMIYTIDGYSWSTFVDSRKELVDMEEWALNDPYANRLMKMDLRKLMLEIYDELKLIKESNKSFECGM